MYNSDMLAGLKRIQKRLARGKGRNSRDCAVMAEIIQKLEDEKHNYGSVTWTLDDIYQVFVNEGITDVPEKALIEVGEEADSSISNAMVETGWEVLVYHVQDYIEAHPELQKTIQLEGE